MSEELNMVFDDLKTSNDKTIKHLEVALSKIRAGKASPEMLQGVMVEYYGTPTPLQQVANINTIDARTITVQPWEKGLLAEIMKGIINSNLGFAPQDNGEVVLINIPPLTEERRRELVKMAKAEMEQAKIGFRNNRKDALSMVKQLKEEGLSEDMVKDAEEEIQKITNAYYKKAEDLLSIKEKDIMTI